MSEEKKTAPCWYKIDGRWCHCVTTPDGKKYVDGVLNGEVMKEIESKPRYTNNYVCPSCANEWCNEGPRGLDTCEVCGHTELAPCDSELIQEVENTTYICECGEAKPLNKDKCWQCRDERDPREIIQEAIDAGT